MTTTTRKKTTRLSKQERMGAILTSAREVFEEQGYEKAKVSEIAERVDVVESTVFHYFGNKRALVLKVMEHFYEQITQDVNEGIKGIEGIRNRLHYIIWFHFNVVNNNAALCGVILRESRGLDQELTNDIRRLNRDYTAVLNQVIKAGIEAGEIQPGCSATMVRNALYGNIEHALWDLLSEGIAMNVDDNAKALTSMILSGISASQQELNKNEAAELIKKLNRLLD